MCVSVASLADALFPTFWFALDIYMHSLCGWWGQPTYSGLDRILEAILAYAAQEEEQPDGATEGNYWSIECSLFSLFIPGSSRCRKVSLNAGSQHEGPDIVGHSGVLFACAGDFWLQLAALQKRRCLGFCKIANAEDNTMRHDKNAKLIKIDHLQTFKHLWGH